MKKLFLVLGMHRSGTSMLTNLIQAQGISLGDEQRLAGSDSRNEKGYFENLDIVNIHDELLKALDMRWYQIKEYDMNEHSDLFNDAKKKILSILEGNMYSHDTMCVKDPRICLFLPLWKEIIDELRDIDTRIIVIYRNPLDVAASLRKRDFMDESYAVSLWSYYNAMILKDKITEKYLFLSYEELLRGGDELYELRSFIETSNSYKGNVVDINLCHFSSDVKFYLNKYNTANVIYDLLTSLKNKEILFEMAKERVMELICAGKIQHVIQIKLDAKKLGNYRDCINLEDKNIIVYGAGDFGKRTSNYLEGRGIKNYCFTDYSANKQGKQYLGKEILTFEQVIKKDQEGELFIIVAIDMDDIIIEVFRILMWLENVKIITYRELMIYNELKNIEDYSVQEIR